MPPTTPSPSPPSPKWAATLALTLLFAALAFSISAAVQASRPTTPLPTPSPPLADPAISIAFAPTPSPLTDSPVGHGDTIPPPRPSPTPFPTVNPAAYPATIIAPPWPYALPRRTECDGTGVLVRATFPTRITPPSLPFIAYLPACYGHDAYTYPTVYLLHSSTDDENHWLTLGLAAHLDHLIATGQIPPVIVILPATGPLGNTTSGGPQSPEAIIADELLPYIDASFCTDPRPQSRAIGGISRGGYWALMLAFRHPDLFSTAAGHSPHLRLETDAPQYNPLTLPPPPNLRLALDWGDRDFLADGPTALHQRLADLAFPHQATVNPGRHEPAYWATHLPDYLRFYTAGFPTTRPAMPACIGR